MLVNFDPPVRYVHEVEFVLSTEATYYPQRYLLPNTLRIHEPYLLPQYELLLPTKP
jgi:hypothetical protein